MTFAATLARHFVIQPKAAFQQDNPVARAMQHFAQGGTPVLQMEHLA